MKKPINISYLFEQQADELFPEDHKADRETILEAARITCRVCGKPAEIPIVTPGLLCDLCRSDIEAIRQHINEVAQKAADRLSAVFNAFDIAVMTASPEVQAAWTKVEAARVAMANGTVTRERFDANWQRRKSEGGEFAELLTHYEGLEQVAEECNRQLEWAASAAGEVQAALEAQQVTRKAA